MEWINSKEKLPPEPDGYNIEHQEYLAIYQNAYDEDEEGKAQIFVGLVTYAGNGNWNVGFSKKIVKYWIEIPELPEPIEELEKVK